MGSWLFHTKKALQMTARTIGAKTVGIQFNGLVSGQPDAALSESARKNAVALARRLL